MTLLDLSATWRMLDGLKAKFGEVGWAELKPDDRLTLIKDKEQGYNVYILEKNQTLKDICKNDKSFDIDFEAYLKGFEWTR